MTPSHRYKPGDPVRIFGGYDGCDSARLGGSDGYSGVIRAMTSDMAGVEMESELILAAREGQSWRDFGAGSPTAVRRVGVARGRWLVLTLAYVGAEWVDPISRIHVGLCEEEPDLASVPKGGGIGCWVESHAQCALVAPTA